MCLPMCICLLFVLEATRRVRTLIDLTDRLFHPVTLSQWPVTVPSSRRRRGAGGGRWARSADTCGFSFWFFYATVPLKIRATCRGRQTHRITSEMEMLICMLLSHQCYVVALFLFCKSVTGGVGNQEMFSVNLNWFKLNTRSSNLAPEHCQKNKKNTYIS